MIRGEIRDLNPAGPQHNDYITYLTNWSVRTTSEDIIRVGVQIDLDLAPQLSRPEPDLLWIRAGRYRDRHPTADDVRLAIEVSDTSLQSDLIAKAALYAEASIVEYWTIDVTGRCVHVFRTPVDGAYVDRSVATPSELLSPIEPCNRALDLGDLFGS